MKKKSNPQNKGQVKDQMVAAILRIAKEAGIKVVGKKK